MLDASAMLAYLRGEPGADVVERALGTNGGSPSAAHAINVCEVYYKIRKVSGEATASSAVQDLKDVGLIVNERLDEAFLKEVGGYKATIGSIPLADCFVVALANRLNVEAMTADHSDFDPISEQKLCRVTFIR